MKPFYPFIIIVLLLLACAEATPAPGDLPATTAPHLELEQTQPDGLETVTVERVTDGDTIQLTDGRKVRYIGINTPERDQPYYSDAAALNRTLVAGKAVQLELDTTPTDQYGRTLAYVWVEGIMVNLEIVRQGYANAFTVPPNVRYAAQLQQAEQEAREAERGLWAGSTVALEITEIQADAPGSDSENPNGEWIEIVNRGHSSIDLEAYTLKDSANHIYTFGHFTLGGGDSFRLYSGQGQDSAKALYWGLVGETVWNNNSDSAFLRDAEGALVDSFEY
jgi:micrococcal nuclease